MTAPVLIFGWGNPSRGDDALGPLFVEQIIALAARHPEWGEVDCLTDFQLQVEHALDLQGRRRVLFVDASLDAPAPFSVKPLEPARDASFTTHAMTPEAVMHVYVELHDEAPPPCTLLAIRGEGFELGEEVSPAAASHLEAALAWAETWLAE
ncbi:MAG: hydrogenase maturation protease [Sulfuritalea sp.]